jgi:hypothetical protein
MPSREDMYRMFDNVRAVEAEKIIDWLEGQSWKVITKSRSSNSITIIRFQHYTMAVLVYGPAHELRSKWELQHYTHEGTTKFNGFGKKRLMEAIHKCR